ncbi:hypothetical protein VP01_625g2 [Puccinia sorghi]|uniref:Uncharacterized protein n=1 Tax=Puccinia sorghi TaxID=27349 RepID=A0A0L6UH93_9BASI|nr:hypothetical protein VP01_625g2 [Puccinia sorghi]
MAMVWKSGKSFHQTSSQMKICLMLIFSSPLYHEFLKLLEKTYSYDPPDPDKVNDLELQDGLWCVWGSIFIPTQLCLQVLMEYQDPEIAGQLGEFKLWEAISRILVWLEIRKEVLAYTKLSFSFQRDKHSNQCPPGFMTALSIPTRPWSVIFIKIKSLFPRIKNRLKAKEIKDKKKKTRLARQNKRKEASMGNSHQVETFENNEEDEVVNDFEEEDEAVSNWWSEMVERKRRVEEKEERLWNKMIIDDQLRLLGCMAEISTIGINFIVKLPLSTNFDSILVIFNHYSKGAHLVAEREDWKAEKFAFIFFYCFRVS